MKAEFHERDALGIACRREDLALVVFQRLGIGDLGGALDHECSSEMKRPFMMVIYGCER
jgi:hypothetical protein